MLHLDAAAGAALKEQGMQLALQFAGDWSDAIVLEFTGWAAIEKARGLRTATVERFRAEAKNQPASHKAWGCLPRLLLKAGLIAPKWAVPGIQERIKATAPRTHCCEVRVWLLL